MVAVRYFTDMKRALVTGATGQDGIYLSQLLVKKGYQVFGTTSQSLSAPSVKSLKEINPDIEILPMSILDFDSILTTIASVKPDEIYNLASISSVAQSFLEPVLTHEVNANGPLRIMSAISALEIVDSIKIYQASSSEMFGQAKEFPQNELTPLNPVSPYALSKTLAHSQCGLARAKGFFVSCGIMFNHESPYRGKDFVSKKICRGVAEISLGLRKEISLGSLEPKRDWGYAGDYVEAMWAMLQHSSPEDFVVSTGVSRSISDLLQTALASAGLNGEIQKFVHQEPNLIRQHELLNTVGDSTKASELLCWKPLTSFETMIQNMVENEIDILKEKRSI